MQLVFDPMGAPFVALAGRDGSGSVEVWKVIDTRGQPRGLRHASFALTLDETPGDQEFILVPLPEPLSEAQIIERLEAGSDMNDVEPVSVVLPKE